MMQRNRLNKIQATILRLSKFLFLILWVLVVSFAYEEGASSLSSFTEISSKRKTSRLPPNHSISSVRNSSFVTLLATESRAASVTYSRVNSEIFAPKCLQCHGTNRQLPNLSSYSSFATNTRYVQPGNANGSLLYKMIQTGMMPQSSPPLSQSEIELVGSWINEGAQNN